MSMDYVSPEYFNCNNSTWRIVVTNNSTQAAININAKYLG